MVDSFLSVPKKATPLTPSNTPPLLTPFHSLPVIRTGGSLISAALAYKNAGASRITVVSTHGVFAGDAIQRLRESGLIEQVVVTDSHPRALEAAATAEGFVKVASIAPLLAAYLESF